MKNIAITGSFAAGKTYILKSVEKLGYSIFSCDNYVKILYQDKTIQNKIIEKLNGIDFFDKETLAQLIYNNDEERKKLEQIIHPLVMEGIKIFEQENYKSGLIFTEIPLLFECGFDKYFYKVICVFCSEKVRLRRALERGLNNIKIFEKIKEIQFAQEVKKNMADYIINSELDTQQQLLEIIEKIQK